MSTTAQPSGQLITEVAEAVREIHRVAELEKAVEVGQVVVDNLYDGQSRRLGDRGSTDVPLRILAFHPELPLSASELYDAVGTFEAVEALGGVDACQHISVDHIRAVLSLPPYRQQALLSQAEQRCWSVRQLAHAASQEPAERVFAASSPLSSCTAPSAA